MSGIVWWEIETAEPARFQEFHAALSGWVFVPAFEGTELGADYWIIRQEGESIGGLQPPALYLFGWRLLRQPHLRRVDHEVRRTPVPVIAYMTLPPSIGSKGPGDGPLVLVRVASKTTTSYPTFGLVS
jgi:hypothetical protein